MYCSGLWANFPIGTRQGRIKSAYTLAPEAMRKGRRGSQPTMWVASSKPVAGGGVRADLLDGVDRRRTN